MTALTGDCEFTARPTVANVSLENLAFNFNSVKRFIGDRTRYLAVVKADAYGHGAVECSLRLEPEGVDWFAVATLEEAVELRHAGVSRPILCLGGFWPGQEDCGIALGVSPVVFDLDAAERIGRAAVSKSVEAKIHVKVDTGMGRVGVPFPEVAAFVDRLVVIPGIEVQGVMTHFAVADDLAASDFTNLQIERLNEAVALFRSRGIEPELVDLANSPGAIAHPSSRGNLVRLGGVLYGLGRDVLPAEIEKPRLKPVLSLHSRIAQVKNVPASFSIGYGRTFTTDRPSIIGTIPIGYRDGYARSLSNRAQVIVNGKFAPVVGRVSMDWITVDLTDVRGAIVGSDVTLIGTDGEATVLAEDLAAIAGTISYEITCGISSRVARHFAD